MVDLAGDRATLSKFGSKNKLGSSLKSRPVIKSISVDKETLNDLQHKLESPNVSNDAKYAVIKKTFGGVCSCCEGIPTKILSYDVKGAQLIEKYCVMDVLKNGSNSKRNDVSIINCKHFECEKITE
jgi:hypothetical protein